VYDRTELPAGAYPLRLPAGITVRTRRLMLQ